MKFLKRLSNFLHWSSSATVRTGKSKQSLTGYERDLILRMNSRATKEPDTTSLSNKQFHGTAQETRMPEANKVKKSDRNK